MTDLVQRLRAASRLFHPIQHDAADALEAKDKELVELDALRNDAVLRMDTYKALCDQMANALDQLTFVMDLRLDDGDLSSETRDAFSALAAWREMK